MSSENFFSGAFFQQLERLSVLSKGRVSSHLRGHHRSARTGSDMIFSDYRPYVGGDDLRNLDWGIYLRLDRLVLRLFEEEADQPVYIFLDVSNSMDFGVPNKLEFSKKLSAALAYIGLINHDRVSLTTYSDNLLQVVPARRGNKQIWRTMHLLEQVKASGNTDLKTALNRFFGAKRSRGLVVIISDFLETGGWDTTFKNLRTAKHDVFAVHVSSPQERDPEVMEDILLVDSEDGGTIDFQMTQSSRDLYKQEFRAHVNSLKQFLHRLGWGYLSASTDLAFEDLFFQILKEKGLFR